jgi:hypothetical protein
MKDISPDSIAATLSASFLPFGPDSFANSNDISVDQARALMRTHFSNVTDTSLLSAIMAMSFSG